MGDYLSYSSSSLGRGRVKCNHYYLSSYFIVVQVKSCPCIESVFQYVDKAPRLLLSKPDVISTSAPLPITVSVSLFLHGTSTSGYFTLSALERDLVDDSCCTNSVDKRCLTSGCKKTARQRVARLSFQWQILCQINICVDQLTNVAYRYRAKFESTVTVEGISVRDNCFFYVTPDYLFIWGKFGLLTTYWLRSLKIDKKTSKVATLMQMNNNVQRFSRSKHVLCQDTLFFFDNTYFKP